MQTWSLELSFTFSENVSAITFLFKHACVLCTQQLALDLENLSTSSHYSFLSLTKFKKLLSHTIPNTLYSQSVIHPNYGFNPPCFHFSALLGMACSPDLCLTKVFQVLPELSPPLWSPPLSNFFWTPKECSLYFLTANFFHYSMIICILLECCKFLKSLNLRYSHHLVNVQ